MNNHFAMDQNIIKQLQVIRSLQRRSETIVQSLYAQAILEYSLYQQQKKRLQMEIDEALDQRDEEHFYEASLSYKQLLESHREGKIVSEEGFELYLPFE